MLARRHLAVLLAGCLAALACAGPAGGPRAAADEAALVAELAGIADASGGRLGVSARHRGTGHRIGLNAGERFPMASTFKVAVALTALALVDRETLSLAQTLEVSGNDLSPGGGSLLKETPAGQREAVTIGRLLEVMMRESDNTATDLLVARVGGPAAVTARVRALGVADLDVSRPAARLVADSWGFTLPPAGARTRDAFRRLLSGTPIPARQRASAAFLADPRDTTTPDAMADLLDRLHAGTALTPATTTLLLDHMAKSETGTRRLRAGLPRGTPVAHKTGTLANVATNDVGIVTLPWRGGHVVLAVYLKGSARPLAEQERTVAEVAHRVYAYFAR